MKPTQRRLHSYRRPSGRAIGNIPLPALAVGARPEVVDSRVVFDVSLAGRRVQFRLPGRPAALVLTAGDTGETGSERIGTVRLLGEADSEDFVAVAAELSRLPETRGLPLAIAGGAGHQEAAVGAALALGPRLTALILEPEGGSGAVCLAPTHFGALSADSTSSFLEAELDLEVVPSLDRRRRRLLGRRLERRLRRDCRRRAGAGLSGRVRAGMAGLAASLAFALSLGFGAGPAAAGWTTTTYDSVSGQLRFQADNDDDKLTLFCDGGAVAYDIGAGTQYFTNPFGPIPNFVSCTFVTSVSVHGANGADTLDLSGVDNSDYTGLTNGDVTVIGLHGSDSIEGPGGSDNNLLDGGTLNDTIVGGTGTDSIVAGTHDDSVIGGGDNDTIDFSGAGGSIDADLGAGTATGQAATADTLSGVESAIGGPFADTLQAGNATTSLVGNGGDDDLDGAAFGPSTISGGGGEDTLDSQSATHADSMSGDSGDDNINGRGGNDTMVGGDDDDTIQGGDTGNDVIDGGAGTDIASYTQAGSGLTIDLSGSTFASDTVTGAGTDTLDSIEGAFGTDFDDTLIGDAEANVLTGEPGQDSIDGLQGDDFIDGGDDSDTLDGHQGANTLEGGSENDLLASTPSNASESLLGETGTDTLDAGTFASTLDGGPNGDEILGSAGADSIVGADGVDTLQGFGGSDTIDAGNDGDTIQAGIGADSVLAGAGNDSIDTDELGGGSTDSDDDTVQGGTGTDTIFQFDGSLGVSYVIDDAKITGAGGDALNSVERVSLGTGSGDNLLDAGGFSGQVTLDGGTSDDTLIGGSGSDSLLGGSGVNRVAVTQNANHTLSATQLTSGATTDTLSSINSVSITGGASANSLDASSFTGTVTLDGAGGNDTLRGGLASLSEDSLIGGSGTDRVVQAEDQPMVLTNSQLSSGLGGGAEIDTLDAIEQASLTAGAGNTTLDASSFSSGPVTLAGEGGSDTLLGGSGSDSLDGGAGTDRVIQDANASQTLTNSQLTGDGTDALAGIEQASLTGGAAANALDASAFTPGAVTMDGAGGDDTLTGGSQSDSLIGGAGTADRVVQAADVNQTLTGGLLTGVGSDTLNGIERASLTGGASANSIDASGFAVAGVTLSGENGSDTLTGTAFGDSLHAGTGTDRLVASADADLSLSDTLLDISSAADDTISGFDEASLTAGNADNTINTSGFSGPTTVQASGGNDTIISGDASDQIFGGGDPADLYVRTANTDFSISSVVVTAAGLGVDTVSSTADISLVGGAGDNSIDGSGSASFDSKVLDGAGGSDTITGGGNPETLLGGAGNDSLPSAGTFADFVDGGGDADTIIGDGQDSIRGSGGNDHMTTTFNPVEVLGGTGTDRVIHTGTDIDLGDTELIDAGDTVEIDSFEEASLSGTTASNDFDASDFSGPVTIFGDAGFDELIGSPGSDSLDGGDGLGDVINQTSGGDIELDDTLITGEGNDTLANLEDASLTGTGAAQEFDASGFTGGVSSSGTTMSAGGGNDTLIASAGSSGDSLDAGPGSGDLFVKANDVAQSDLTDTLLDESGFDDDSLAGFEAASLAGGAGANDMDASGFTTGNVTLVGLAGSDTLVGTPSAGDSLDAGADTDRLAADADADFTLTDALLTAGVDVDSIAGFDEASLEGGGAGNDFDASGFSGPVTMFGYNGDDTFRGGSSSDLINGGNDFNVLAQEADASQTLTGTQVTGDGTDSINSIDSVTLTGGAGNNTLDASAFNAGPVNLIGLGGNDSLTGNSKTNLLDGGSENDTLSGLADDDTLAGGAGTDRIFHQGTDAVLTDSQLTGSGTNTISSIEQASLDGSSVQETIDAGAFSGAVTVDALGSNDTVIGAGGDDSLNGNTGIDYLVQGSDAALQELSDVLVTGDGSDTIASLERASLTGGASANRIDAAAAGSSLGVTLDGAGGNDTLTGTIQTDSLFGGTGTDEVRQQGATPNQTLTDTLLTGSGSDVLDSFEQASLLGSAGPNVITATGFTNGPVSIDGAGADDTISGSGAADLLDGGDLDDNVNGNGGADTLIGETGIDTLEGGLGGDELEGGNQADELSGDGGADTLQGGDDADTLDGGDGADELEAGAGSDSLEGGLLGDTLSGDSGVDTLDGGDGADELSGGGDGDQLLGGSGDNTLEGDGGSDSLTALTGADSLDGGAQADTLAAGDGPDTLAGGTGSDSLDGEGGGADFLSDAIDADLTLTDTLLSGGGDDDTLAAIEEVSLSGGPSANSIDASGYTAGSVSLAGLGGDDSLIGSAGDDDLDGGPGTDVADYSAEAGAIDADLGAGTVDGPSSDTVSALENVVGTAFADVITGNGAANGLIGNGGNDTLTGGGGIDALAGGADDDELNTQDGGIADAADCGPGADVANADIQDAVIGCETVNNPGTNEPGGPVDDTAPGLSLSGKKKQKDKKKVVVDATCSDEACDLEAKGTIKVKILKKNGKVKKTKKFNLKTKKVKGVAPGEKTKLKVKFDKKTKKKIKKVIKKKKSKATVEVTAADEFGNVSSVEKFKVTVKK